MKSLIGLSGSARTDLKNRELGNADTYIASLKAIYVAGDQQYQKLDANGQKDKLDAYFAFKSQGPNQLKLMTAARGELDAK